MIQIIGIMVATYIIVRMIDLLVDESKNKVVRIVAAVNMIFTFFFIIGLLATGATGIK